MIPYGRQSIDDADVEAVAASLRSDWLTQGPALGRFEAELAERCCARFAVACNSGTAALHMAYAAAGIGPGKTVVVPANTFLATANAAIYLGANVRFCDVDPQTGLMVPQSLDSVLDDSVAAVVPVHFAGQACDMAGIQERMQRRCPGACLIEDASHAIGGVYADGSPIGTPRFGSMITFSFHPVKQIAAGEGGAVTTDSSELRERLQRFRCHGMTKDPKQLRRADEGPWYYEMHSPGFNYRIPEAACALASSQLRKLDRFVDRRCEIAQQYLAAFAGIPHLSLPPQSQLVTSAWHLFCLHIDFEKLGRDRVSLASELHAGGVGSQVHYFPVPAQPYYADLYKHTDSQFPGAFAHYRQALSIPLFPGMTDSEVQHVISTLKTVLLRQPGMNRLVA